MSSLFTLTLHKDKIITAKYENYPVERRRISSDTKPGTECVRIVGLSGEDYHENTF